MWMCFHASSASLPVYDTDVYHQSWAAFYLLTASNSQNVPSTDSPMFPLDLSQPRQCPPPPLPGTVCVSFANWISSRTLHEIFCPCSAGMVGYGMAKAAVHQLTQSLAAKNSGMPSGAVAVAILPWVLLWHVVYTFRSWCINQLHDVKENRPLQISECCLSAACRPDSRIVLDLDPFRLVWKWREYLRDWFELSMHVFYFYLWYLIFQCWTVTRITHDFWTHLSLWETNVHFSQFFSLFFTVLLRQNDQLVNWKTMERFIYE